MADKEKPNGHRIYILTVEYNKDSSEIIGIKEEFRETDKTFNYGEMFLEDYWDEETVKLMDQMYEVGLT